MCWRVPCTGQVSHAWRSRPHASDLKRVRGPQEVLGRSVTLLRHGGKVYCVDSLCSHMGGPLGQTGDIEDMQDGSACIKCPWHNFRVRSNIAIFLRTFQRVSMFMLKLFAGVTQ